MVSNPIFYNSGNENNQNLSIQFDSMVQNRFQASKENRYIHKELPENMEQSAASFKTPTSHKIDLSELNQSPQPLDTE